MNREFQQVSGRCLCGAVKFSLSGAATSFHLCYCSRCRHSTGSAHASNIFSQPDNITWLCGKDNIQRFELPSAKSWAKQFCKTCGSGLPYVNRSGTHLVIPAGSLDDEISFEPDDKIFCDARTNWVNSIPEKREFPGLPDQF